MSDDRANRTTWETGTISDATERLTGSTWDVSSSYADALRPIEPPGAALAGRVEDTLSAVTQAAAEDSTDWAAEYSESELRACATRATGFARWWRSRAGSVATGALVLLDCAAAAAKHQRRTSSASRPGVRPGRRLRVPRGMSAKSRLRCSPREAFLARRGFFDALTGVAKERMSAQQATR